MLSRSAAGKQELRAERQMIRQAAPLRLGRALSVNDLDAPHIDAVERQQGPATRKSPRVTAMRGFKDLAQVERVQRSGCVFPEIIEVSGENQRRIRWNVRFDEARNGFVLFPPADFEEAEVRAEHVKFGAEFGSRYFSVQEAAVFEQRMADVGIAPRRDRKTA